MAPSSRRWSGSAARMGARVRLLEAPPGDVGVDLCRAEILMSQELLDRAQIRAPVEEVRREGMAKRVRMHGRARPEAGEKAVHVAFEGSGRDAGASGSQQDGLAGDGLPSERLPKTTQHRHGSRAQGNDALAAPLSEHADEHAALVQALARKRRQFPDPEPGAVEKLG